MKCDLCDSEAVVRVHLSDKESSVLCRMCDDQTRGFQTKKPPNHEEGRLYSPEKGDLNINQENQETEST